jgi:lipopolysaccharide biosynthesis protein
MSTKEKEKHFLEAARYMENAAEILRTKANKKDRYYQDLKYVKMACGTAYNAVLMALETFFEMKGMPLEKKKKNSRTNVKDFEKRLALLDKKALNDFRTTYNVLHLDGYYDGISNYDVIKGGMDAATQIVNKIKPIGHEGLKAA